MSSGSISAIDCVRCSDGQGAIRDEYLCQLFLDNTISLGPADDGVDALPSVQLLLERYFVDGRLSFACQPDVLLVQLPRSGAARTFAHILPNAILDVTHLVHSCELCTSLCHLQRHDRASSPPATRPTARSTRPSSAASAT